MTGADVQAVPARMAVRLHFICWPELVCNGMLCSSVLGYEHALLRHHVIGHIDNRMQGTCDDQSRLS